MIFDNSWKYLWIEILVVMNKDRVGIGSRVGIFVWIVKFYIVICRVVNNIVNKIVFIFSGIK